MEPFRDAVNEAAARSRGLWLGFIALLAYLFITVGAVSHRELLLQSPVRLPVLNVDLPLVGFFVVAPLFFLINHFYLLLQLKGLGSRIRECNEALRNADLPPEMKYREQRKLDSFVIVQMLGGTEEERTGLTGRFLKIIALITLVFAPVTLLLMIQLQFLPYQDEIVTWWHRIALLADLTLIWIFWFAIREGDWDRGSKTFAARLTVLCLVIFSCFLASFPGEYIDGGLNARTWKTHRDSNWWWLKGPLFGTIAGGQNQAGERERRWPGLPFLSRALRLADDQALIDHDTFDKIRKRFRGSDDELGPWDAHQEPWQSQRTRSFRNRNLRGAALDRSDLRNVDFAKASLQGASLDGASLQGASLDGASLQGASLDEASLQGASLFDASLQDASLVGASLQDASLESASLQGASLDGARLQGASLDGARLQGASLNSIFLWRAYGRPEIGNPRKLQVSQPRLTAMTVEDLDELEWNALAGVVGKATIENILQRLARLRKENKDLTDSLPERFWTDLGLKGDSVIYQITLAGILKETACADERGRNAPHVAKALIDKPGVRSFSSSSRLEALWPQHRRPLARHLLDAAEGRRDDCPGVKGLDQASMARLREWAAPTGN